MRDQIRTSRTEFVVANANTGRIYGEHRQLQAATECQRACSDPDSKLYTKNQWLDLSLRDRSVIEITVKWQERLTGPSFEVLENGVRVEAHCFLHDAFNAALLRMADALKSKHPADVLLVKAAGTAGA